MSNNSYNRSNIRVSQFTTAITTTTKVCTIERFTDLDKFDLLIVVLPHLPVKITLNHKVVKSDSKIIILLQLSKSVTYSLLFLNQYFSIGRRKKAFSAFYYFFCYTYVDVHNQKPSTILYDKAKAIVL